eukprot:g14876.t1
MSQAGDGGDESASSVDPRLQELSNKYDFLGDEVVTVADKVSTMEGQLGEILGMLRSARLGESGSAASAASSREESPAREPKGVRGGDTIAAAPQQQGGGTRPGDDGPAVYPAMSAGSGLATGPSGNASGFYSQGLFDPDDENDYDTSSDYDSMTDQAF